MTELSAWAREVLRVREDAAMAALALQAHGYLPHLEWTSPSGVFTIPAIASRVACPPWCPGDHSLGAMR